MKILGQIVDTVKLHIYLSETIDRADYKNYLTFVDGLKEQKKEAQLVHHTNNDMRYVNHTIAGNKFRVMATTFQGFSVTLKNNDVTISFKTVDINQNDIVKEAPKKRVNHTHSPIAKIEFRASFLARVGHISAMNYALDMFTKYILSSYDVKISEIHLATDIQGYNFTELDFFRFKTRKRTNVKHIDDSNIDNVYYAGRKFTGLSFGRGDEMLRIYDKTEEIRKFPDKAFVKDFVWKNNLDYIEDDRVWRIEIQYRRAKLKTLYTNKSGLLDGYQNILDSLPDLWGRALDVVEHKDMSDEHCLDMIRGYHITKDGDYKLIENEAIRKRYYRAETSDLWNSLRTWSNYVPKEVNVHKAPKTSAFQWVSNSIKSLFSTLLKFSGDLTPEALESAFARSDNEIFKKKGITLVDNAYANTMDYLGNIKKFMDRHGVYIPYSKHLDIHLPEYVKEITRGAFDGRFDMCRVEYLNRSLARMA